MQQKQKASMFKQVSAHTFSCYKINAPHRDRTCDLGVALESLEGNLLAPRSEPTELAGRSFNSVVAFEFLLLSYSTATVTTTINGIPPMLPSRRHVALLLQVVKHSSGKR